MKCPVHILNREKEAGSQGFLGVMSGYKLLQTRQN